MKIKLSVFFLLLTVFLIAGQLSANPFAMKRTNISFSVPATGGNLPLWNITAQQKIKTKMTYLFNEIKTGRSFSALILLLLISFIYGLLHAAGPGHHKGVVFSLFIAKKAYWWEPLWAGFLVAVLHAFMGVFLIMGIKFVAGRILSVFVEQFSVYLTVISYLLLFFLVLGILIYKLAALVKRYHHGHIHSPVGRGLYSTIIISGLIPCPGATIIMIFAVTLNMIWSGILSVAAMSAGMGITISLAGYLAFFSKESLFKALRNRADLVEKLGLFLEIGGLLLVLLFSLYMLGPLFIR